MNLRRLFWSSYSRLALIAAFWLVGTTARAQLAIEIIGAGTNRNPVAVADFLGERRVGDALTSVIRNDLEHCGLFRLIATDGISPNITLPFDAKPWRVRGADAVAAGMVNVAGNGLYFTSFRLYDTQNAQSLAGVAYTHSTTQNRLTAHRIADVIYEKLIHTPGYFSTRIAYVVKKSGERFELQIADADGANAQTVLASHEPLLSPMWSPDGKKIAYVSYQSGKKPVVFIHDLLAGRQSVLANYKGSNSAPAWSPDGKRLAIVLTRDGHSQIYLVNANGSGLTRLMASDDIDTEPRFSADGKTIFFTSDRGGSPQIYQVPVEGGMVKRLTFSGEYNVTPRPSPDGKSLAYISRDSGRFRLVLMDLASQQTQFLTDTNKDESPSFAPNGRMILFATEINGNGVLTAVSSDGSFKQKLSLSSADIREPAWGPWLP